MSTSFGTLHCTLLDRRSSAPLAGARVTCVWRTGQVSVITADDHGSFVTPLPEGVYDLAISARGYLSLVVRGVGILAGYHQTLVRGLVPGEGRLDGEPSTAIAGIVRDRIGMAVPNAAIHLNGAGDGGAAYTTNTDAAGRYIVHGVVPGTYDLAVRSGDRTVAREHVAVAHAKSLVRADLRLAQQ